MEIRSGGETPEPQLQSCLWNSPNSRRSYSNHLQTSILNTMWSQWKIWIVQSSYHHPWIHTEGRSWLPRSIWSCGNPWLCLNHSCPSRKAQLGIGPNGRLHGLPQQRTGGGVISPTSGRSFDPTWILLETPTLLVWSQASRTDMEQDIGQKAQRTWIHSSRCRNMSLCPLKEWTSLFPSCLHWRITPCSWYQELHELYQGDVVLHCQNAQLRRRKIPPRDRNLEGSETLDHLLVPVPVCTNHPGVHRHDGGNSCMDSYDSWHITLCNWPRGQHHSSRDTHRPKMSLLPHYHWLPDVPHARNSSGPRIFSRNAKLIQWSS